ncbi:MAG: hypothetical protein ABIL25_06095, partial [candidate division WOR-3 bacterium]
RSTLTSCWRYGYHMKRASVRQGVTMCLGRPLLPALDLDELLALRVSYETRKRQAGGHDVPWPALVS